MTTSMKVDSFMLCTLCMSVRVGRDQIRIRRGQKDYEGLRDNYEPCVVMMVWPCTIDSQERLKEASRVSKTCILDIISSSVGFSV